MSETVEDMVAGATQQELQALAEDFRARLLPAFPEAVTVLESYDQGADLEETAKALMGLITLDQRFARAMDESTEQALVPFQDENGIIPVGGAGDPREFLVTINPDKPNLYRLNPFYEAALIERASLDGDVPEARFGPLAEGAEPAVPVETTALSPVAVGMQLEAASQEVASEIKQLQMTHRDETDRALADHFRDQGLLTEGQTLDDLEVPLRDLIEDAQEAQDELTPEEGQALAELGATDKDIMVGLGVPDALVRSEAPEPEGYKRGVLPALRNVGAPTGASLLALSEAQRQHYASKAITTTQGRRSALSGLRSLVRGHLRREGLRIQIAESDRFTGRADVGIHAEWVQSISDPGAISANFSPVTVAAGSLSRQLAQGLQDRELSDLEIELAPVNAISERQVGWQARVVQV